MAIGRLRQGDEFFAILAVQTLGTVAPLQPVMLLSIVR
jgi:hypothetical protein